MTGAQHDAHLDAEEAERPALESAEAVLAVWRDGAWCRWCNTRPELIGTEPGLEPDPYCPAHGYACEINPPASPEDEDTFPPDPTREQAAA